MAERLDLLLEADRRGLLPEDQKALLDETRRRGLVPARGVGIDRPTRGEGPSDLTQLLGLANVGVTQLLGFPVDVVNAALSIVGLGADRPVGGAESLQAGLAKLGMGPTPTEAAAAREELGILGTMAEFAGASVVPLPGAGLLARLRGPAQTVTGAIGRQIGRAALERPARFTAAELTAGAAAGGLGGVAEQRFPDTPAARVTAEIVGGLLGGGLPALTSGLLRTTGNAPIIAGIRNFIASFSPTAGEMIGGARIRAAVPDTEAAARALADVEAAAAGLTPAQRVGAPELLSLERSVADSSAELGAVRRAQFEQTSENITTSLRETGGAAAATPDDAKAYLTQLLDERLRIATARAEERLEALATTATREEANRAVKEQVEAALKDAVEQNRALWGAVPLEVTIPAANSAAAAQTILTSTPKAQLSDIPDEIARVLVAKKTKEGFQMIAELPASELQGLRSKLLEIGRQARFAGERNKARITDDMADAILADMNAAPEVGDPFKIARDFTAELSRRFHRGEVGKLLGFAREGGEVVPAGLALETTVALPGARGREAADALRRALDGTDRLPSLNEHIESFVIDEFRRAAVRESPPGSAAFRVDPARGDAFLRNRQDVLSRLPALQQRLEAAVSSGRDLDVAARLADPDISAAAVFTRTEPAAEIRRVIAHPNPKKQMQDLIATARTDPTGRAEAGVKATMIEYIEQQASVSGALDADKLRALINNRKVGAALHGAFSNKEIAGLRRLADLAEKLAAARAAPPAVGGIEGGLRGMIMERIAGIFGAAFGRRLGTGTIQAPGIAAGTFQRLFLQRLRNPARRFIIDALDDEALLRTVLEEPASALQMTAARRRLHGWALAVIAEETGQMDGQPAPRL